MKKKSGGRDEADLEAGIARANGMIRDLASRDGVDTSKYGFMVRRAGDKSLAVHRGSHPAEDIPTPASGSRDPRMPRAQVGLSASGALKTDLRKEIEERHDELVHLHRWSEDMAGRPPRAADFRWDPVILAMLRLQKVDLNAFVARGPGEFVNPRAARDYPSVANVLDVPDDGEVAYLGCIDGDVVRALRIRYTKGVYYSWSRIQPNHVELMVKDRQFPQTVLSGLLGATFMTVVDHASLAPVTISGYAQVASTISFKSATRLVRT